MSAPTDDALWEAYLVTVALVARALASLALGAVDGKRIEGAPLTRSELLAEVARLCGEAGEEKPAEEDDANAAWLTGFARGAEAERKTVLDAIAVYVGAHALGDEPYVPADGLRRWIAEQRAVKP